MNVPRLTKEQAAIIGTFTGISCGPFSDVQEYGDKLMGRPTWTHEYGNKSFADRLKELAKADFFAICHEGEK